MTFVEHLEVISIGLGILGVVSGAAIAAFRKLNKVIARRSKERKSMLELPEMVFKIDKSVEDIRVNQAAFKKELEVNGGGSIKDEVRLLAAEKKAPISLSE